MKTDERNASHSHSRIVTYSQFFILLYSYTFSIRKKFREVQFFVWFIMIVCQYELTRVTCRVAKFKFSKSGLFKRKPGVYQEIFLFKSGRKSGVFFESPRVIRSPSTRYKPQYLPILSIRKLSCFS
jgi:hypothetical protein